MKSLKVMTLGVVGFSVLLSLLLPPASAQQVAPPFKIILTADKTAYGANEPIKLQVRVFNDTNQPVITREGFFDQHFYLQITFTGPGGPINTRFTDPTPVPDPPLRNKGRDATLAEIIPPKGEPDSETLEVIDNAHTYYDLPNDLLTAQVLVPVEIFSQYDTSDIGEILAYLDDPNRQGFNPLASNKVSFEILPPEPVVESSVYAIVSHLKIKDDTTAPGASKEPLQKAIVRLFLRSKVPPKYQPINWKQYAAIWEDVPDEGSQETDSDGLAIFEKVPKDDYLILANHPICGDFKHMGSPIDADDPNWFTSDPIKKHLMVMEKPPKGETKAKKMPCKTTKLKGSELLITEPEYVEWDGSQETYPFVFESIGDWDVTVSVEPPEGFVSDHDALRADVVNELEAVQFSITDVGSKWKEAKVKYEIKHKGKTEKINSKIGVKLSKKLAKKKRLGVYGHTPEPKPYRGGKKVGQQ